MAEDKKKDKKKKKKKGDALAAFKASIAAQKEQEEKAPKNVDVDAELEDEKDDVGAKHGRTTTEHILLNELAGAYNPDDDDDDGKAQLLSDEEADAADGAFLTNLNTYLAKDFMKHKRSWSTMSSSSNHSQGASHGRSGTLFSLSHSRTKKESMQLILSATKLETKERKSEYELFDILCVANEQDFQIEKLTKYLEKTIDLSLLWLFMDILLFKLIKYYTESEKDDKIEDVKTIYSNLLNVLNQRKLLKNSCFRQYIKFLSSSNSDKDNPIGLLMDALMTFEDASFMEKHYSFKDDKLIQFWQYIANKGYKKCDEIDVNTKSDFYDPIRCDFDYKNCFIQRIIIRKVFNSANKPLLLEIHCADLEMSSVILKKGDDLRKDKALMNIFKFMNYIWFKESKQKETPFTLKYKKTLVKILTFDVVAMTNKIGIIELVPNCIPLRHINKYMDELIDEHKITLITSAAASYIGSFVTGVKDRHFDNILLRTDDCTLFHIDFGYCLGESIKNPLAIDTSTFAITEDFYHFIGKEAYEEYFVPLCVDTFMCLRKYAEQLIDFTMLSFSYLFKEKQEKKIRDYLTKKLKVKEQNEDKIKEWLSNEIKKAPFSKKTKLKNKLHRMNAPTLTEEQLNQAPTSQTATV
eukprot:CAMPEP_0197050102 /NCGR_PEP_ID=MMETSP1384-20130603/25074_1 /TAXON_ID=29189 /ORGANISM="Ammonia sp." /LENGTH=636 /DNA_ID=CAMNT_0042482465 /DNA_START=32 /DNA_END=1942 /DNA_ORIENTATION=-